MINAILAAAGLPPETRSVSLRVAYSAGWALDRDVPELGRTLGEELLTPTRVYAGDLLVLARDGREQLGPPSLGKRTRFVVDHAACAVLLVWGGPAPAPERMHWPPHLR